MTRVEVFVLLLARGDVCERFLLHHSFTWGPDLDRDLFLRSGETFASPKKKVKIKHKIPEHRFSSSPRGAMSNFHPMGSAFSAKMESNSKAVKIELCRAMRRAKEENERRLAAKAAKEAEDELRKEREMAVIEIDAGLATVLSRSLGTPKALLSALSKAQALVAAGEQSSKAIEAPLKEVNLLSFTGGDAISLISALSSEVLGLQPGAEAANLVDAVGVERLDRPEVGSCYWVVVGSILLRDVITLRMLPVPDHIIPLSPPFPHSARNTHSRTNVCTHRPLRKLSRERKSVAR